MQAKKILNNVEDIKKIDVFNMNVDIKRMPESIENAIEISKHLIIPKKVNNEIMNIIYTSPENIIIIGMGGSAIGGDLLKEFLLDKITVPIEVVRDYNIPQYVSKKTLVIVISYSGNTEETLNGFKESIEKNAMVVALSSNGLLNEICKKYEIPIILVPENIQPRASLPYLFFPLLIILNKFNLIPLFSKEIDETLTNLKELRKNLDIDVPFEKNISKQIAGKISNRIGLIFAPPRFGAVARRIKCQLNENSKNLAFWDVFSELNHNEVVGWERKLSIQKEFILILLRSNLESLPTKNRINITKDIIFSGKVNEIVEIKGEGEGILSQYFSKILIGDYISFYLAILNGVDPSPVKDISKLKKELKSQYDLIGVIRKIFLI